MGKEMREEENNSGFFQVATMHQVLCEAVGDTAIVRPVLGDIRDPPLRLRTQPMRL